MSSSYSKKTRIAYHIPIQQEEDSLKVKNTQEYLSRHLTGKTQYSVYSVVTEESTWESIVKKDRFYQDVEKIETLEQFTILIQKDSTVEAFDVARYILSKVKCTHLKLQKLTYLCYQEYLKATGKKMFKDEICAYALGPVIRSLYEKYSGTYGDLSSYEKDYSISDDYDTMAKKSRIIFATDGLKMLSCIDKVLTKYGECSASKLVDITHGPNSAWSKTYKNGCYNLIIPDDVIINSNC